MLVEKNRLFDTNYQAVKGQQFLYFRMHKKVAFIALEFLTREGTILD